MENDDTIVEAAKIITGAVYSRPRGSETEEVQCIARITDCGRIFGLFRRFGLADERVLESSEEMMSWKLVSTPILVEEPTTNSSAAERRQSKISDRTGLPTRKYNKRAKQAK